MEITGTFYAATSREWRSWLEVHHADRAEIWLIGYRKVRNASPGSWMPVG